MKHSYRCDSCGCYLDPGEGRQCDEYMRESKRRIRKMKAISEVVAEGHGGQYEMRLQEAV